LKRGDKLKSLCYIERERERSKNRANDRHYEAISREIKWFPHWFLRKYCSFLIKANTSHLVKNFNETKEKLIIKKEKINEALS